MKRKVIYLADDGAEFESKEQCRDYEYEMGLGAFQKIRERRICRQAKIVRLLRQKDSYAASIHHLKQSSPYDNYSNYVWPTKDNINYAHTLPRIEKIIANAKQCYFDALKRPSKITFTEYVGVISRISTRLHEALSRRCDLISKIEEYRKLIKNIDKQIADLRQEEKEESEKEEKAKMEN